LANWFQEGGVMVFFCLPVGAIHSPVTTSK
jgi:hypothetical protein